MLKKLPEKVTFLLIEIAIFSMFYYFLNEEDFGGINVVHEKLREKEVEDQIEQVEPFQSNFQSLDPHSQQNLKEKSTEVKEETREQIKEVVKDSWLQKYFNSLYFAMDTGTTLGRGDIYPVTNRCKVLVAMQLFTSLVIVSM